MKPACCTVGRTRQRLKDITPTNPTNNECWNLLSRRRGQKLQIPNK